MKDITEILLAEVLDIENKYEDIQNKAYNIKHSYDSVIQKLHSDKQLIDNEYSRNMDTIRETDRKIRQGLNQISSNASSYSSFSNRKYNDTINDETRAINAEYGKIKDNYLKAINDLDVQLSNCLKNDYKKAEQLKEKATLSYSSLYKPDFNELNELYSKLMTDTFSSFTKRVLHRDGYSSQKDMLNNYIIQLYKAKLYLEDEIRKLPALMNHDIQEMHKSENIKWNQEVNNYSISLEQRKRSYEKEILDNNARKQSIENNYMANCRSLQNSTAQIEDKFTRELSVIVEESKDFASSSIISNFATNTSNLFLDSGILGKDWQSASKENQSDYYFIGKLYVDFKIENEKIRQAMESNMNNLYNKDRFILPFLASNYQAQKNYIRYSQSSRRIAESFAQNIIIQKMRAKGKSPLDIHLYDPNGRGQSFASLLSSPDQNGSAPIFTFTDSYDIKNDIESILKGIDKTNSTIGATENLYAYNRSAKVQRKETFLVFFDVENCLRSYDMKLLTILWNNAERCGVNIILASMKTIQELQTELIRNQADCTFLSDASIRFFDIGNDTSYVTFGNKRYLFQPDLVNELKLDFIRRYRETASEEVSFDNDFLTHIEVSKTPKYEDATNGIRLPIIMRQSNGELCNIVLGTSTSTHTLITGGTGSGKSTLLHAIILSTANLYHPDDVEIWLQDYGTVEFNHYVGKNLKSIRFLSLEKYEDFTYSFIDYIIDFFEKRAELFRQENVSDIAQYRAKHGKLSMPRILIMIDECHVMTQHIMQNPDYKMKLENTFTEYRKFGLSYILSNQGIEGLKGLTETAMKQIRNRIAMLGANMDIQETLAVNRSNYTDEMLHEMERTGKGELWYKEWIKENDFTIDKFKGLLVKGPEREEIIRTINSRNESCRIDDYTREFIDDKRVPYSCEVNTALNSKRHKGDIILQTGKPATIENNFFISLTDRYKNNLAIIGPDSSLCADIAYSVMRSAKDINNADICLLADDRDEYYEEIVSRHKDLGKTVNICDDLRSISRCVARLHEQVMSRKTFTPTVLVICGITDLIEELKMQKEFDIEPEIEEVSSNNHREASLDDLLNNPLLTDNEDILADLKALNMTLDDIPDILAPPTKPIQKKETHDTIEELMSLIKLGARYSVYTVMLMDNFEDTTKALRSDMDEYFIHRIAVSMPTMDSTYAGFGRLASEIDKDTAIYTDGKKFTTFKPFL